MAYFEDDLQHFSSAFDENLFEEINQQIVKFNSNLTLAQHMDEPVIVAKDGIKIANLASLNNLPTVDMTVVSVEAKKIRIPFVDEDFIINVDRLPDAKYLHPMAYLDFRTRYANKNAGDLVLKNEFSAEVVELTEQMIADNSYVVYRYGISK